MVRFEILRYDASRDDRPRFQTYELAAGVRTSVLEALLKIQDEQDPSLAFRYACRGAVCGSCAMSINGKLRLACRVLLNNLPTERVVLEPLPRLEIVKDLVVDMDPFWEKYEQIRPWLHARIADAQESRVSEKERERIDQYVNCILCGLCYAACPVISSNEGFTGPAALAKLYRFVADSRENRRRQELEQENTHEGMWGCRTITRCIQVCPKNVRPTDGIEGVRRRLLVEKLKGLFRRTPDED
jgi:succinate dehydrogenase / fumarate reductase iron-sulfur subunit